MVKVLTSQAPKIAERVAEEERQAEIERQKWEVQQAKWQREQAERRRAKNVQESTEELLAIIEGWDAAMRIERFFEEAERRLPELEENEARAVRDRLARAREWLGGADALARFRAWKAPDER